MAHDAPRSATLDGRVRSLPPLAQKREQVNAALREQYRTRRGRKAQPTATAIDSQSVKTTESGGPRGYDGGKKVSGRKRQTLVDTEGDVLKVRAHPADLHDKIGGMLLLAGLHLWFPAMQLVRADTHYQGLKTWAKDRLGWTIEVVKHWWTGVQGFWLAPGQLARPGQEPPEIAKGFNVLPRRWVVGRTRSWLTRCRRLVRHYEQYLRTSIAFIRLAMIRLMLRRLTTT